MKDEMDKDLGGAVSAEEEAAKGFGELAAAKKAQIAAAGEAIEAKTKRSGELAVSVVTTADDIEDTTAELSDTQAFLANLASQCATKKNEWDERSKIRTEEVAAISEAIKSRRAHGRSRFRSPRCASFSMFLLSLGRLPPGYQGHDFGSSGHREDRSATSKNGYLRSVPLCIKDLERRRRSGPLQEDALLVSGDAQVRLPAEEVVCVCRRARSRRSVVPHAEELAAQGAARAD